MKKQINEELKRLQELAGIPQLKEINFGSVIEPIKDVMKSMGYGGGVYDFIIEGYRFIKDMPEGVMVIIITPLHRDKEMLTFTATFYPEVTKSKFLGLIKSKAIDFRGGKTVSKGGDMEIVDLGTGMFSLDKPGVAEKIKSLVQAAEQKAQTKTEDVWQDGSKFHFAGNKNKDA